MVSHYTRLTRSPYFSHTSKPPSADIQIFPQSSVEHMAIFRMDAFSGLVHRLCNNTHDLQQISCCIDTAYNWMQYMHAGLVFLACLSFGIWNVSISFGNIRRTLFNLNFCLKFSTSTLLLTSVEVSKK